MIHDQLCAPNSSSLKQQQTKTQVYQFNKVRHIKPDSTSFKYFPLHSLEWWASWPSLVALSLHFHLLDPFLDFFFHQHCISTWSSRLIIFFWLTTSGLILLCPCQVSLTLISFWLISINHLVQNRTRYICQKCQYQNHSYPRKQTMIIERNSNVKHETNNTNLSHQGRGFVAIIKSLSQSSAPTATYNWDIISLETIFTTSEAHLFENITTKLPQSYSSNQTPEPETQTNRKDD